MLWNERGFGGDRRNYRYNEKSNFVSAFLTMVRSVIQKLKLGFFNNGPHLSSRPAFGWVPLVSHPPPGYSVPLISNMLFIGIASALHFVPSVISFSRMSSHHFGFGGSTSRGRYNMIPYYYNPRHCCFLIFFLFFSDRFISFNWSFSFIYPTLVSFDSCSRNVHFYIFIL